MRFLSQYLCNKSTFLFSQYLCERSTVLVVFPIFMEQKFIFCCCSLNIYATEIPFRLFSQYLWTEVLLFGSLSIYAIVPFGCFLNISETEDLLLLLLLFFVVVIVVFLFVCLLLFLFCCCCCFFVCFFLGGVLSIFT